LRSLLVVVLISIPVAAGTAAAVIRRTTDRPANHGDLVHLGTADLAVDVGMVHDADVVRSLDAEATRAGVDAYPVLRTLALNVIDNNRVGPTPAELAAVVDSATVSPSVWSTHRTAGARLCLTCSAEVRDLALDDPLVAGIADLRAGRAPVTSDEIAISPALSEHLGVGIGDGMEIPQVGTVKIVGEVIRPAIRDAQIAVVAPSLFDKLPLPFATSVTLFDLPGPRSGWSAPAAALEAATGQWDWVTQMARKFSAAPYTQTITLRDRTAEPGSDFRGNGPGAVWDGSFSRSRQQAIDPTRPAQLSTVVAAALVMEVALVAAAAFAVGTRRRVVEFGQMATAGADPIQIRVLVLAEAIVMGSLGVATGVGLALGGVWLARDPLGSATGQWIDHIVFSPIDVVGPALLGLAGAVAAAWFPARTVSRVPVTTALAGRVPFRAQPRWVTPLGLTAVAGGLLLVVAFARAQFRAAPSDLETLVGVFGAVAVLAGAALLSGPLIGLMGRGAGRLGSVARLAVRDSNRQRARAGTAVAAMMVTIAIPTTAAAALVSSGNQVWDDGINPHYVMVPQATPMSPSPVAESDGPVISARMVSAIGGIVDVAESAPVRATPLEYFYGPNGESRAGTEATEDDDPEYVCVSTARDDLCTWRVGVADEAAVRALGFGPEEKSALAAGNIVLVGSTTNIDAVLGQYSASPSVPTARIGVATRGSRETTRLSAEVPIVKARKEASVGINAIVPNMWISLEAYAATGVPLPPINATIVVASHKLSSADRDAIRAAAWRLNGGGSQLAIGPLTGLESSFYYPQMHSSGGGISDSDRALLVVLAASVVAALIAIVVAALSAVELDRDLGVMVAAGAPPSLRRRFLGVQSAYHVGLAAVLGIPTGLLLYWAITNDGNNSGYDANKAFPWVSIGLLGIVLPLAVGIVIAAMFRSGRPIQTRRMT